MGLAASQARFLSLTARKSNVQYQGQQVNQQRTALSNESATMYNNLMTLKVPTPPDINNYYTKEYTFTVRGIEYTIANVNSVGEGYDVTVNWIKNYNNYEESAKSEAEMNGVFATIPEGYIPQPNSDIVEQYPNKFTQDSLFFAYDDKGATTYVPVDENCQFKADEHGECLVYTAYPESSPQVSTFQNCQLEMDSKGNYSSIKTPLSSLNVVVSTKDVCDETNYNIAMNEYKIEYSQYEKTISEINAKTATIQQQDKTLELRLKQLDTEEEAIKTEMDAIKTVIEKNIENTFKTFG